MTQLKRQLKHHAPSGSATSGSTQPLSAPVASSTREKTQSRAAPPSSQHNDEELRLELALPVEIQEEEACELVTEESVEVVDAASKPEPLVLKTDAVDQTNDQNKVPQLSPQHVTVIEISNRSAPSDLVDDKRKKPNEKLPLDGDKELELALMIENEEREKIILQLAEAIEKERKAVEHLQELLAESTL